MSWSIAGAVVIVVAAILLALRFAGREAAPDVRVLSQLRQAGSDLSKPHPVEFFLYFPSEGGRDRIASRLKSMGFGVSASRNEKSDKPWSVVATKTMVPETATIVNLRSQLSSLASSEGGDYDGWGTPVVK